jgi:arginyl-tRNA synthetase
MNKRISDIVKKAITDLGLPEVDFNVEFPADMNHGDYSTNVAMVLASSEKTSPREIAQKIKDKIEESKPIEIEKLEIAGAGFINFYLTDKFFIEETKKINETDDFGKGELMLGKKVLVEYTQPNPFKPFHIGHLMSNTIGESISRILEWQGANVVRVNYQGDKGLHVAKAIYGIKVEGGEILGNNPSEKAQYIGECYAKGSDLYEKDANIKTEIDLMNEKIYADDAEFSEIYKEGREVTLEAFEEIYKTLGTKFDKYYFESEVGEEGKEIVIEGEKKGVFEISDGAYVFHGEKYNPKLHTRVFVTSKGLPLYEAKEVALTLRKFKELNPDLSVVTTAVEQQEYMRVVTEAIQQLFKEEDYAKRMKHINHGMMRFATGKMSSRLGNVITGESLLKDSKAEIINKIQNRDFTIEEKEEIASAVGVSAIKYSILKSNTGTDIAYDFDKSISFEGDSGPYLQYAAVRAQSIISRSSEISGGDSLKYVPNEKEMAIARLIHRFPETTEKAFKNYAPHMIASFLVHLAGKFNHFYSDNIFIDPTHLDRSAFRVETAKAFLRTIKNGLYLLGIKVPQKM